MSENPWVLVAGRGRLELLTREQLKERVRSDLAGSDLVGALLQERRRNAVVEDRS